MEWIETLRPQTGCSTISLLPHQVPPEGDWLYWLLLSGRGGGKTFASAKYFDDYAREHPGMRGAIIAPTLGDARKICVEGETGLLRFNHAIKFNRSWGELEWPNESKAVLFGAHTPDDVQRLRGPQHELVWFEELAAARALDECWQNMRLGLRLGKRPHAIVSTTPQPRKVLKALLADSNTVVTRASTADNPHLHESVRSELYKLYGGTRIGRQELSGELLEDVEGALWKRELIEDSRAVSVPELTRVVVSVDPSATAGGDACGIVVAGRAGDHAYVLEDLTLQASPNEWAKQAIAAYHKYHADRLVAETNQGGEMVRQTIHSIDPTIAYRGVHAKRGKVLRAEPIVALYEQARVHHVGSFAALEDEMCSWIPGEDSPNRIDALVHGFTDLMITKKVIEITLV
jgi:phage terminase large subunit-like protein